MKNRKMNYENLAKTAIPMIVLLCAIAFAASPASAIGEAVTIIGYGYEIDGVTPLWFDGLNITVAGIEYNQTTLPKVSPTQHYYTVTFTNGTHINPGDTLNYYAVNNTRINNTAGFTWDGNSYAITYNVSFPPAGQPDLTPTAVWYNQDKGGYLFANETNDIMVNINNSGSGDAGSFDVTLEIGDYTETKNVPSLLAGENANATFTDYKPTTPGDKTVNITADKENAVTESNKSNNLLSTSRTVYNNGYKGKRWTGGADIITVETYDIKGNVTYSTGSSAYTSGGYTLGDGWKSISATWTSSDLPIPSTATVLSAKLYVYYNWDITSGALWGDNTTFNGVTYTKASATHYSDVKGWGSYSDNTYGTLVYNVTSNFNKSGNTVNLGDGINNRTVSIDGMILHVVYSDANEPQRMIWINEGYDLFNVNPKYGTDPTETIAYAPFTGGPMIDPANAASARLIAVGPGAGSTGNKNNVIFNSNDHWDVLPPYKGATQIGIADIDVTSELGTSNEAAIQDNGDSGGMRASTTILAVEYKIAITITNPANGSTTNNSFVNVTVTLDPMGTARYLNWQGQNYTMAPTTPQPAGTVFYRNMSGLLSGNYTFKVYANDSSGVSNVSETRIVTVNRSATTDISGSINTTNATVTERVTIPVPDINVTVDIPVGTVAKNASGNALTNITTNPLDDVGTSAASAAASASLSFLGKNLSLGPDGAAFVPDIQIRFNYTDDDVADADVLESELKVKWYNTTTGAWETLTTYEHNQSANYIIANASHFTTFVLIGTTTSTTTDGSGSSSSTGGGVVTSEPYTNIEKAERYDKNLIANTAVTYTFKAPEHGIYEIAVTGKESENDIAVRVEALKGATKLAAISPSGTVYKNVNIWSGTKRIKEVLIRFKVENSWLASNNLAGSDVKMVKWDGSKWAQLETKDIAKDTTFTSYEAKTDTLSAFAITGLKGVVVPTATPAIEVTETPVKPPATAAPVPVPTEKEIPGFEGIMAIVAIALLVASLNNGRKRR